ncbi:unnamed protein product, partial [Didymodactylos carnosus]
METEVVANILIPDHNANVFNPPGWTIDKNESRLDKIVYFLFSGLRRWDGIYFLHIARYGYSYENSLAFFPAYPLIVVKPLAQLLGSLLPLNSHSALLLASFLDNIFLGLFITYLLFHLSVKYGFQLSIAYWSSIIFCINPATIFFIAPYSECLFLFSQLLALLFLNNDRPFVASLLFGFGLSIRANGIVSYGFILYYWITEFYYQFRKNWLFIIRMITSLILYSTVCFTPFILVQYYRYKSFCTPEKQDYVSELIDYANLKQLKLPSTQPYSTWCNDRYPFSYWYIQNHYWNVGFLNYWKVKQIPNFLLSSPVFYIIFDIIRTWLKSFNIRQYYRSNGIFLLFHKHYQNRIDQNNWLSSPVLVPHVFYTLFLMLFALFFMHVQSPEEIHEHTIPEDLPLVEKTLALIESRCNVQQFVGIRMIVDALRTNHEETISLIIPKFKNLILESIIYEEHAVFADALVMIMKEHVLNSSQFLSLFGQLIVGLIFTQTSEKQPSDLGEIWCNALCEIIGYLPDSAPYPTLLDLIISRSLNGSVRDRLCSLLAKLAPMLQPQVVENRLLPVFRNFVNDTNPDIRSLAARKLPFLGQSLGPDETCRLVIPLIRLLTNDESFTVREACFETILDITDIIAHSSRKEVFMISETLLELCKFAIFA